MSCKILVVEDEIFVAVEIESVVAELGHEPVGIAADASSALVLAPKTEIALVDLNLRDGPTGPELGRTLAERFGVTVLFMTANPSQLGDGIPGTIGVIAKPVMEDELRQAVNYAVSLRRRMRADPPRRLRLFHNDNLTPGDEAATTG
ncbi:MAG: response regulator [Rhizobiaceae bacterium]|nr:response regulator [Rhizobiaceae bacterium]